MPSEYKFKMSTHKFEVKIPLTNGTYHTTKAWCDGMCWGEAPDAYKHLDFSEVHSSEEANLYPEFLKWSFRLEETMPYPPVGCSDIWEDTGDDVSWDSAYGKSLYLEVQVSSGPITVQEYAEAYLQHYLAHISPTKKAIDDWIEDVLENINEPENMGNGFWSVQFSSKTPCPTSDVEYVHDKAKSRIKSEYVFEYCSNFKLCSTTITEEGMKCTFHNPERTIYHHIDDHYIDDINTEEG